ncbi:MAG TPA: hypothetical protein VG870_11070 [Chitinophagaceae bacterium]|nr:hypothetical protein [Chitinophagaceae bacterium]
MTYEQIEDIIKRKYSSGSVFEIRFKARNPIKGLFIVAADYRELSRKNLWRIVSEGYINEYRITQNESLARIFNGTDFTRLEVQPAALT